MKIVIGCPVKDRAWVLPSWFKALGEQDVPHTVIVAYSDSEDGTGEILEDHGAVILRDEMPGRSTTEIDGHLWGTNERYVYMCDLRNRLSAAALAMEADYFLSLDSDILMPPQALQHLLTFAENHPGIVSPAVNMAHNRTSWNVMSWSDPHLPTMAYRPPGIPPGGRADVVMAALLMDPSAMALTWTPSGQGEDVGLCLSAHYAGVPRWWVPEIWCQHLMMRTLL